MRLWTLSAKRESDCCPSIANELRQKASDRLSGAEIKREYGYLFGMIEPLTGKDFMMEMPRLDTDTMKFL